MHLFIPAGAPPWLVYLHIAGGLIGILAGAVAVTARKGSPLHRAAGKAFTAGMAVMGAGALILGILIPQPGNAWGGAVALYLVATAWLAAQTPSAGIARGERIAALAAVGMWGLGAGLMAFTAASPGGRFAGGTAGAYVPLLAFIGFCLWRDLSYRAAPTPNMRLRRHLWRMSVLFFAATGSFFLGQQKTMPAAFKGAPVLWLLALAPLAVLAFWLWKTPARPGAGGGLTARPAIAAHHPSSSGEGGPSEARAGWGSVGQNSHVRT